MEDYAAVLKGRAPELARDGGARRYRTGAGRSYPSITAVLGATAPPEKKEGLERWKASEPAHAYITRQAQETGTQAHRMIEDYLRGSLDPAGFDLLPAAHFQNLLPYLAEISDVVCTEQRMHSDRLRVAGTSDLIASYRGELSVIDYKTKRRPQLDSYMHEYYLQATCYALMFEEATGRRIDRLAILVSSEKNTRQEFVRDCADYVGELEERIDRYHLDNMS